MLGVYNADHSLRIRRKLGHVLLGIDVEAAHEDAIDSLRGVALSSFLDASPAGVAGNLVLALAKDQSDVDGNPRSHELFECREPTLGRGYLDHPVLLSGRPFLAECDVLLRPFGYGHVSGRIFQKRVEFKADVAIVSTRLFPDRFE